MRKTYFIIATAIILFFFSCKEKKVVESGQLTNDISIRLVSVEKRDISRNVTIYGSLTTPEEIKLSFKTTGIISRITVKEGDRIYKGQVLAELDFTEVEAQLTQVKEKEAQAERDYQRSKTLYADSVISLEQCQNAETAWSLSKQALDIMEYNKTNSRIIAFHDGVVLKKNAGEGELVAAGFPVFSIASYAEKGLILKSGISVTDWKTLSSGDKATLVIEGFAGKIFSGEVQYIAQSADRNSGLYPVEVKLHPDNKDISVGMFVKCDIQASKSYSYDCIPVGALTEVEGNKGFVYIPDGNKVKKIPVSVSFVENGYAYINEGLQDISHIINEGAGFLSENSSIRMESASGI